MWSDLSAVQKALALVLGVAGLLAAIVGVIYIALPAHSIPHFFPSYSATTHHHATKHGIVALAAGVVLIVIAVVIVITGRRNRW
jgi:uncharacterized membrane protein HdeD (DUF308 family)